MRIRLYVDEDAMRGGLVVALRAHGVDVITALDVGMVEFPDEEHLKYATAQGRALYSFNKSDFYLLHTHFLTEGLSHAGIILAQQRSYSIGEQMPRLLRLIAARSAEKMIDQVEFLSAWN